MTPEASASVHVEFVAEPIRSMPRLGKGLCWSLLVAEMAADEARRTQVPNPWTPTDPEPSGEAA